jgi:hypothetical protein
LYAIGFRYYFTPLTAVLFTFPSRYWFTIGCQGVFSLIRWSGQIHAEFHLHRVTWDTPERLRAFAHPAVTVYGRSFQIVTLAVHLPLVGSRYPGKTSFPGLGCSAFARHYLRNHSRFLFLGLLRCFTSPRVASPDYEFIRRYPEINRGGLSHSEIHGSEPVCGYPWLIATCYVLHRLLAPRHPPIALGSLITKVYLRGFTPEKTQRNVIALSVCGCQRTRPDRTGATCVARGAPNQPKSIVPATRTVVGLTGLEPVTLRLSSACSNQLSYRPMGTARASLQPL